MNIFASYKNKLFMFWVKSVQYYIKSSARFYLFCKSTKLRLFAYFNTCKWSGIFFTIMQMAFDVVVKWL